MVKLLKGLTTGKPATGGRSRGTTVTKRRGLLIKKNYRFVDFKRNKRKNIALELVKKLINDPNRNANLSLIYATGLFSCVLASQYTKKQKIIKNLSLPEDPKETGYSAQLQSVPLGSIIHNLENTPQMGGIFIRAAGASAILLRKFAKRSLVKLKSGELRYFSNQNVASLGAVSNQDHFLKKLLRAGDSRLLGKRPRVRPSAMNPVDHPMGGRTKGGCAPQSKTGKLALCVSPIYKKKHNLICVSRRKKWLST